MSSFFGLLFALAAFAATVVGVNLASSPADAPMNFDIYAAVLWIASNLPLGAEVPELAGLAIGAFILAIPAIIVFYPVRAIFGGR